MLHALRIRLALAGSTALLATGCMGMQQTQQRAGVLDFLYPPGAEPVPASDVHLALPLRVGVAFAPLSDSSSMTEPYLGATYAPGLPVERQQALLERVVAAFRDTPGVATIQVIPAQYLRPGGGFENVDQLRALFGIDLFALVSYDQVQYHDYNLSSLTYWTVLGAYVIEGDDARTHTFVDVSVFDVPSRCLLFDAAGRSRRDEDSTAFEFGRSMRADAYGGFDEAMQRSLKELQLALDGFREQAKSGTVRGVGSPNLTVSGQGAGALDPAALLLVLAGVGTAWSARRKQRTGE